MARFDSAQRARLLAAAVRVFARHGVDGASIRQVAEAAGFNSALLYYYFENKQTLYVAAVRQIVTDLLDQLERQLRPFANGRDRVRFLVDGVFAYYGEHPERMQLMGTVHTQQAELLGGVIQELLQTADPAPLRVLREGLARGEFRPFHPVHIWWTILGTCVFMQHMHRTFAAVDAAALPYPLPSLEEARAAVMALLCDGLVPTVGRSKRQRRRS